MVSRAAAQEVDSKEVVRPTCARAAAANCGCLELARGVDENLLPTVSPICRQAAIGMSASVGRGSGDAEAG